MSYFLYHQYRTGLEIKLNLFSIDFLEKKKIFKSYLIDNLNYTKGKGKYSKKKSEIKWSSQ